MDTPEQHIGFGKRLETTHVTAAIAASFVAATRELRIRRETKPKDDQTGTTERVLRALGQTSSLREVVDVVVDTLARRASVLQADYEREAEQLPPGIGRIVRPLASVRSFAVAVMFTGPETFGLITENAHNAFCHNPNVADCPGP